MGKILKERFNRKDIKKVNSKQLGDLYLTTLVSLIKEKQLEGKKIVLNQGLYVFVTSSNHKSKCCKYFSVNGQDAINFFLKKVLLKSTKLYVAIGLDYFVTFADGTQDCGAEDLIICGDDYPDRKNTELSFEDMDMLCNTDMITFSEFVTKIEGDYLKDDSITCNFYDYVDSRRGELNKGDDCDE